MIRFDELLEEVNLLYQGNKFPEMIALLNDALLEDSTHAELYFFRGMAWTQRAAYDKAIEDLTAAIVLRPDYFRAYHNRGITWNIRKKYDNAIGDLNKAIALRPNYGSTYQHLANAWREKKDYDKALLYYDQAVALKPDSPQVYLDRAAAWYAKEEYGNALEDCNKAIALDPAHASSYTDRGNALYGMKQYAKALESYHRAIEIRPHNGRAYFGLGRVYEDIREFYSASIHYKRSFYLGFDKTRLVEVFKDKFPAPYIVKSILSGYVGNEKQEINFSIVEWLIPVCQRWDSYLDELRNRNCPVIYPEKYYSLEAIVNYYMGNSIAAYKIFDTAFDSEAHPYPLTLRDQYYLALSAVDFKEPDNGLAYAVEQIRKEYVVEQIRKEEDGDDVDNYYAGWLFLLSNDPDNALGCFNKCRDFLPALYGKIAVYKLQEDTAELLRTAEKIAVAEAAPDCPTGFLNGIRPLVLSGEMSFEEVFSGIMRHVHYYELTEEIEEVRRLLGRPSRNQPLAFNALLEFSPSLING